MIDIFPFCLRLKQGAKRILFCKKGILLLLFICLTSGVSAQKPDSIDNLDNKKIDGYRGIWFELGQRTEYGDKYSGGLGTYTAKHIPLAVYAAQVGKTFFVYGGTTSATDKHLLCMIGAYDHKTQKVSKPTVVYDKRGVDDPHDNPTIVMDSEGYIWVFVSGRNLRRPGFKFRSKTPYSIDSFEEIRREEMTYPQPKYIPGKGFLHLFTKYSGVRELYFETSADGVTWTDDQKLAGVKRPGDTKSGHYQISGQYGEKVVFFFNWHPDGNVDRRTNIYYLQTVDFGKTWTTVEGKAVDIPVTDFGTPTLLMDYFTKEKNVYIKDVNFDERGNPIALYLTGKGHEPGPRNGLKDWYVLYWNGTSWENHKVATSDHNYDTGSLFVKDNEWIVIAPTENSPQKYGAGGEIVIWKSRDKGKTWKNTGQITEGSLSNHNYVRKVTDGMDPFYYFWADGNPDKFGASKIHFGDSHGTVWQLPYLMIKDWEMPLRIR